MATLEQIQCGLGHHRNRTVVMLLGLIELVAQEVSRQGKVVDVHELVAIPQHHRRSQAAAVILTTRDHVEMRTE